MNTIYSLIRSKTETWIKLEKESNQSLINNTLEHIEKTGMLRPPQREAIETYLWIKFASENKRLSEMVREGLLYDDVVAQDYENYYTFKGNYVTQFLNQFFQDNDLKNVHKKLVNDPTGSTIDWNSLLDELLHNFDYSNYLFSLPMGAGKTFLMACFIYLDLYFATLFKNDKRFAHNFVVFAPQASKTAILPSLRTIKDFNPEWILPREEADKLKQIITIEILDSLSSKRKDKLHGNNPNLEKVNRIKQTKDFGMVFITNAEKVVLEKYDAQDEIYIDPESVFYDVKKASELKKTNELREALSQIFNLTVILDEVHHSYSSTGKGEKKLRQAVGVLNQHSNVNSVIGLSGTPYVKTKIEIEGKNITLNQIQDIVYNYPLNIGIGKFLKKPDIRKASVKESVFLEQALTDFFSNYDIDYDNGTKSKVAFYCPSIKKLNDDILPIIQKWYQKNRAGKEDEIFRYYSNVDKKNKQYELPKEGLAIFNNLDKPYSKKRVILLVAIGTEGWDCRSLTSVVLPRQKTTKNFVLQTTCRCLREVTDASKENALIYLSADNYETLDKELKENYQLSITDLSEKKEQNIEVQVRKPKLGKLKYKQIETKYKIVKKTSPEIKKELSSFNISNIKNKYSYDRSIVSGSIGKSGLTGEVAIANVKAGSTALFSLEDFIYNLSSYTYGLFSEADLLNGYYQELTSVYKAIEKEIEWLVLNPNLTLSDVNKMIASSFMDRVEYTKEVIEQKTEIELLEWQGSHNEMSFVSPKGVTYKFMPEIKQRDYQGNRGYGKHPEYMEDDFFSEDNNCDPQDISYNYIPYKMDSGFEQNALAEMLKLSELKDLEVYFNGYKDERLQSFWIQTPRGRYTPDFLILRRKENKKYRKGQTIPIEKAIIIETKGKPYYNDEFRAKEKFVKDEFLKHNNHFSYHCFVDDGENDFTKHLNALKQILKEF
ncbi:MAG: DEAD/DEAH box helicase family protein [Candidatus Marinimicrobia bacterium]|nr:DEAD/DEAH box helicase family protein [Candidatus Neomarinimicrobiota bacterium]